MIPAAVLILDDIRPGRTFDTAAPDGTPIESGCLVVSSPDPCTGAFIGLDSDGVECSFCFAMVSAVYTSTEA